ncbi:MAG: MBL fold metallo-hydrolase [Hyphomonas sp.]|jgi:ribonuclease Z|nr:MBL fold metallo-hydrolase [Hyphomonas sp.]
MGPVRWTLLVAALAAAGLFAGSQIFRVQIAEAVFERAVKKNVGRNTAASLGDGLHVYVCGAGSPFPDPLRGGPCLAVVAGDEHVVIDAGSGGVRTLTRMGYPVGKIDAVLLTHLHSDHMDGLGELLMQAWVNGGRKVPMPVHGPSGVEEVVNGFNAAYRIDSTYRTGHHGPEIAPPEGRGGAPIPVMVPAGPGGQTVVYDAGGLTITAFRVSHAPVEPAFGYRVDYQGRSVSISGDSIYDPNLVAASTGADLLFHDALNPEMVARMRDAMAEAGRDDLAKVLNDILDYHATPADAARAAQDAGVSRLVLYHTVPPLPSNALNALFTKETKALFDGPVEVAVDGLIYSLPAGNQDIHVKKAF